MSERRRSTPRADERRELAARWEENCKRGKAGWALTTEELERYGDLAQVTSHILAVDAQGKTVTVTTELRGADARASIAAHKQHLADLRAKVESWNKETPDKKAKEISGEDVMEVLDLAFVLTNHPAYEAARKALRLHRLDAGGLRRAFLNLQRRHHNDSPVRCAADAIDWYMDEFGYKFRRAVEQVVANEGVPGTCFDDAVEKVRKAYARREQHEAERQQYLEELNGLRDPGHSR
jgi:hypothetical protein